MNLKGKPGTILYTYHNRIAEIKYTLIFNMHGAEKIRWFAKAIAADFPQQGIAGFLLRKPIKCIK
jgi:hypothetical protein